MNKQAIRKEFLEKRNALPAETVQAWSSEIEKHILQFVSATEFRVVFLYADFRNEPKTLGLIEKLLDMGCTVGLPKCGKKGKMTMYRVKSTDDLSAGAYGILEPPEDESLAPVLAGLVLVPGCAFSYDGKRLGYGGGYYDRFLPLCKNAIRVGVCYNISLANALPVDDFDVEMDCLITETGLVNNL